MSQRYEPFTDLVQLFGRANILFIVSRYEQYCSYVSHYEEAVQQTCSPPHTPGSNWLQNLPLPHPPQLPLPHPPLLFRRKGDFCAVYKCPSVYYPNYAGISPHPHPYPSAPFLIRARKRIFGEVFTVNAYQLNSPMHPFTI